MKTRYPFVVKGSALSSTSDYESLSYDNGGNVTQRRLRDSQLINLGYDNLGRLASKDLPGSEPDVSYGYDLFGRMLSASQTGSALSFTYDALGRNTGQTGPMGSTSYSYDVAGRRTQMNYGAALLIDYDYLVTGETTRIRESGATSGVGVLAAYAYDDLGRRTSLTRGNGTAKSYGYDAASRLASMGEDLSGTTADLTLGFTYNPASQIAANTRSNDSYAWTAHYNVSRNYTANGLNQYSASGSVTPSYDARGNLTSAGTTTYGYSAENMLTSATGGIALTYDPMLRLQQTAGGSAGTTKFAYDGQDLIAEYDGSNAVLRRYVHGPGSDEPVVWYEGSGTADRRWLHADERGSVIAVSNSSGATIATNAYDEYGIPKSTNLGRFQYTGQTWLPELGMYHYKARIYSPTLGRFLQTDPIGYGDGMNIYAYVSGDPVNKRDPSGLCDAEMTTETTKDDCPILVTGSRVTGNAGIIGVGGSGETSSPGMGAAGPTPDDVGGEIVVTGQKPKKIGFLRRVYRWFVTDPCKGRGTNEGAGVPAAYDPYDVDEKGSLAVFYGHVLPDHDFSSPFSESGILLSAILIAIQSQPAVGSGGSAVYTVNTGRKVGFDAKHGAGSDYLTVVMGPAVNGTRTLRTAYPGCR